MIACQFKEQSWLLFEANEIHIDKIFKQITCREFKINIYSHKAHHIGTIIRIFTDSENELGYYRAIDLISQIAEQDMEANISWDHLTPESNIHRIRVILIDEYEGQAKDLDRYFAEKYPIKNAL